MTIFKRNNFKRINERNKRVLKNESIADDSHNLWYSFAEELEKGMKEQGVDVDIWLNDMGFMEVTEVNEGTTCIIYAKTYQDGGFMSQQIMIEQEGGSFLPGEKFDTGEMPDAYRVVPKIQWIEPQYVEECRNGKLRTRRMRRNEASMSEIADDKAAQRYLEVDPKNCPKAEFVSRLKVGDLFVGRYWGTTSYFKVTGFRGGRVVLSSIGKTASGKLVPGVSEPLFVPDPSKPGSEKGAHAQPIKSYSGCELASRDWTFELWDGTWNFHDINGALGF